jgi:four helix bundle protein
MGMAGGAKLDRRIARFTDLEVWRKSHELFLAVLVDLEKLPKTRAASILVDQTIRALGSIGANLAEGFNRSRAKYLNSIDIALGEANESENWLYKIRDAKFLPAAQVNERIAQIIPIQRMLAALHRSIRQGPDRKTT